MMRAVLRGLWDGLSVIGRLLGPRQLRSGRYPGGGIARDVARVGRDMRRAMEGD